jgi:AmmeMemoRadiSam system protein B
MIREPFVAGQFYPADPDVLRSSIRDFQEAEEPLLEALGIVAPHAGYVYSGPVAGAVYSAVRLPERFIILGPNHTGRGAALALHPPGEWRTPLGRLPIDPEMNEAIVRECGLITLDSAAHAREHSIEVQVPFLQTMAKVRGFSALCVGRTDYSTLETVGRALARTIRSIPDPVLLITSSDMTHYEPQESASRKDSLAIDSILKVDSSDLYRTILDQDVSMCGFAPAVAMLTACRDLGATSGRLIRYATSGDVSGDYRRVVGYAGIAVL